MKTIKLPNSTKLENKLVELYEESVKINLKVKEISFDKELLNHLVWNTSCTFYHLNRVIILEELLTGLRKWKDTDHYEEWFNNAVDHFQDSLIGKDFLQTSSSIGDNLNKLSRTSVISQILQVLQDKFIELQ